jgi:short-subunit dehydrogenase
MVALSDIREANTSFSVSAFNDGITAVFVGATSGIGLATVQAFVAVTKNAQVYIVGRSLQKFTIQLNDLQQANSSTKVNFIEAEISLIREVDRVCREISSKEEKIDVLWLSSGILKFGARDGMATTLLFINIISHSQCS